MRIILDHTQAVNDHVTSFWFKPEQPMHFIAGQFIELTLPHDQPDDRGTRRWFTISSSPTDPLISITAKLGPEHSSSFKRALRQLQPGAELTAIDAMGVRVYDLSMLKQGWVGHDTYANAPDAVRQIGATLTKKRDDANVQAVIDAGVPKPPAPAPIVGQDLPPPAK